jgi:uncharacterized membrane protein
MADVIQQTNKQIISALTPDIGLLKTLGWVIFIIILIAAGIVGYYYYKNKKLFNKVIRASSAVNGYWVETYYDTAKSVKIGSGGFEILYLKKLKTWKLAHSARTGMKTYEYYIMPDGYWYPAKRLAEMYMLDANRGYIPVITTNPLMRAQYTSLEKQINDIHAKKKTFWEQYGNWVLSIAFVLIAGVMLWMNYKEFVVASGNLNAMADKFGTMIDRMNIMIGNLQTPGGGSGLTPVS